MVRIEESLNACLDRLASGSSLEDCLARYPEQRAELEPLLRTALAIRRASDISLRPQFRVEGKARLVGAMAARRSRAARPKGIGWGWRWAIAGVLIIFLMAGQVVRASAQSLPGETLYPVKRATEQVRIKLTISPTARLELMSELANERVQELVTVAQERNLKDPSVRQWFQKQADSLVQSQASSLRDVAAIAEKDMPRQEREAISARVQKDFERQKANLWRATERAPEAAQPALRQAFTVATEGYQKALQAVAQPEPRKEAARVKGLVAAVRPQDGVVVVLRDKVVPLVLAVTSDTHIERNGALAGVEALASGDLIAAVYDRDSLQAIRIEARSPAQARGETVGFSGVVESQQASRWVISGRVVVVGPDTELDVNGPVLGGQARVVAEALPDGSLLAQKLVVGPAETPGRPERPQKVQFTGTIEDMTPTRWLVSGREIIITQDTTIRVEGHLRTGAQARVVAERRPDGSLLAREIRVVGKQEPDVRGSGDSASRGKDRPAPKDGANRR